MRPVRIIAAIVVAATVGMLTLLAAPAWAAPVAIHVSPSSIAAGHTVTYVSAHEQQVTLSNQAGQPVRGWRIISQTDLGTSAATPALVGGDPVVIFGVSQQTKATFLYEYLVLRLAPAGGTRQRFTLNPDSRAVWGDEPITGVRVGPDGQLYQLRTDPATGASIARYSLAPTQVAPPTTTPAPVAPPATAPPVTHPPVSQPTGPAPWRRSPRPSGSR